MVTLFTGSEFINLTGFFQYDIGLVPYSELAVLAVLWYHGTNLTS
jgi:hypothetical protein